MFSGSGASKTISAPASPADMASGLFGTSPLVEQLELTDRSGSKTGLVLRAIEGPSDAVVMQDPDFFRVMRSTTEAWMPPYGLVIPACGNEGHRSPEPPFSLSGGTRGHSFRDRR